VLLITVDDMNWDSVGVYGCKLPGITPNMDRLAEQGMRFEQAHVTIAICQPTRAVWMTGRYPHRNGALGFDPIRPDVVTLPETLKQHGYYNGLMAKHGHVIPTRASAFHEIVPAKELKNGRSPERYYEETRKFLAAARQAGKPFFLMANSQDPHRPFAGSRQEKKFRKRDKKNQSSQYGGGFPDTKVAYDPAAVPLPGFLPDLPQIRLELAQYYTSVHRADAIVGAVLKALEEAGLVESTLVIFLSDHGMPLPFAKTNVWRHSTRIPWIVRWPGVVQKGAMDGRHLISGIDLTPTILEACGLPRLEGVDGRSIVPLLTGGEQEGRDWVFTQINTIASKRAYPMRCIQNRRYGYIYNAWADGKTEFRNESQSGLTFEAMRKAGKRDAAIAARVHHFQYRTREEFYDYEIDPDALHNLAMDPAMAEKVQVYREKLRETMRVTEDPQLSGYDAYLRTQ
jgi:N-sulfoglucosamine sulfohydrolase